jgi:hypothetical protein
VLVLEQPPPFSFPNDPSPFEDVGALGQRQYCVNALFYDEQAHPLAMQLSENGKYRLDDSRSQSEGRFVEKQQVRKSHQSAAQREHLLLAA